MVLVPREGQFSAAQVELEHVNAVGVLVGDNEELPGGVELEMARCEAKGVEEANLRKQPRLLANLQDRYTFVPSIRHDDVAAAGVATYAAARVEL